MTNKNTPSRSKPRRGYSAKRESPKGAGMAAILKQNRQRAGYYKQFNTLKIMTQDEFIAMQKKEHEAYLATMAAINAQRKALVLNYKAARERRVKAYEAQIVHNPKRHLNHDCYRLHHHFKRELEAVLTDGRTHGLNLENSSVQFAEDKDNVIFTITVPKK